MSTLLVVSVVGIAAIVSPILISYIIGGRACKYFAPVPYDLDKLDLHGKFAVVTGANTGLGFVTAKELAKRGCNVIATSRSQIKGDEASKKLEEALQSVDRPGTISFWQLDLASLSSVQGFTDRIIEAKRPIDYLFLNAGLTSKFIEIVMIESTCSGVMFSPFELTADKFELQIGTVGIFLKCYLRLM